MLHWTAEQIHTEHLCVQNRLHSYLASRQTVHLPGDVGGQRTLRPYWRNYFEQTDALVWVVDSGDRMRMQDCREELHSLLLEDVSRASFVLASAMSHVLSETGGCFSPRACQ